MKKIIGFFIMTLLIGTTISHVSAIEKNHEVNNFINAEWTIMVYMDGDNDLEEAGIDDFLEMSSIGSTSEVNIIVQFDRIPGFSEEYDDWNTTKRYLITKNMIPDRTNAIMDIGEANMGDPETAIDFIIWSMENYPANNYCIIFWDHGVGWKSLGNIGITKGVCEDWTDGDSIEIDELSNVLATTTNNGENSFDLIGFDACLMQMIEVSYELANYGKYMTASEKYEPLDGWNYDEFLQLLIDEPSMTTEVLGSHIVNTFKGPTLSTIDLGLIYELVNCVSDLGSVLHDEENREIIQYIIIRSASCNNDPDNIDLYDFTKRIIENQEDIINPDEIIQKAYNVQIKFNETVTSVHPVRNDRSKFHGITIYAPSDTYYNPYDELLFARNSLWNEFLKWLCDGQTNNPPNAPIITGPSNCKPDEEYEFRFLATDPEGDNLYFQINWGDGNYSISGNIPSGEELVLNYSWSKTGVYCIAVYSIDAYYEFSDTTIFYVTVPKSKSIDRFNLWFSRLIQRFPIFELLL